MRMRFVKLLLQHVISVVVDYLLNMKSVIPLTCWNAITNIFMVHKLFQKQINHDLWQTKLINEHLTRKQLWYVMYCRLCMIRIGHRSIINSILKYQISIKVIDGSSMNGFITLILKLLSCINSGIKVSVNNSELYVNSITCPKKYRIWELVNLF